MDKTQMKEKLTELIGQVQDEGKDYSNCFVEGDKPVTIENGTLADYLLTMGFTLSSKQIPQSPYPDGDRNILSCPWCRSGEFLHNADGTRMPYCGQCGQAIKWEDN